MNIKQVIEKAIEGGYKRTKENYFPPLGRFDGDRIFLDPNFWQCLGKEMGWKVGHGGKYEYMKIEKKEDGGICGIPIEYPEIDEWLYQWHKFIDHLAEGDSVESFFEKL